MSKGTSGVRKALLLSALAFMSVATLRAQEPNCSEVLAMARLAHARSLSEIHSQSAKAGNSYRAKLVLAARSFELRPHDEHEAVALLNLIPRDDGQNATWMTMGDSLCDDEPVGDMKAMGRIGEHLPRDVAKAVLLLPDELPRYVEYALKSVHDPHSDYAVQMQPVCRTRHSEFVKAVDRLPADQKNWFVRHVFNPDACRALALPEAE